MKIGIGWDQHPLVAGRPLVLGGERFDGPVGLSGHSDADVLVHAVCDAVLGALGAGDIGGLFPPSDERYRGVDSMDLLQQVADRMRSAGHRVGNVDAIVIAQAPRLSERLDAMRRRIAAALDCAIEAVNLKAKSPEGIGALGRQEAISARAIVLLVPA